MSAVEFSTEVDEWLDARGNALGQEGRRQFYSSFELCIKELKRLRGVPDGDRLRLLSQGDPYKFWLFVIDVCWNVTYYVAPPRVLLLTVFSTVTQDDVDAAQEARAAAAKVRCMALGDDVANI